MNRNDDNVGPMTSMKKLIALRIAFGAVNVDANVRYNNTDDALLHI